MKNINRELLEQLFHLEWLLRRSQMFHHRAHGPMGAPYQGQGRILALLKLKPEISQKELSTILDIRSQSLGELLAKLENQGYITRTPSTEDRRVMNISLTEAGKAAAESGSQPNDLESFFDCLTPEEQATLANYLERLIKTLKEQMTSSETDFGMPSREGFRDRRFGRMFRRGGPFGEGFMGFGPFGDPEGPESPFDEKDPKKPTEDEA
jgi:DNA-binding MarR family transcriptional regulator